MSTNRKQNLYLNDTRSPFRPNDNMRKEHSPLGPDYDGFMDNQNKDFKNLTKNDDEDQKEENSENTNIVQIIDPTKNNSNITEFGGDEHIINFKKKLQSKNFNTLSDKEIILLLEEIFKQIKNIEEKANDPNSIYNKSYFDKEINYLEIKAKELERIQNSFNHSNIPSQRIFDSSDDKIDIAQINKFVGNKERLISPKYINHQENISETTSFTSKNHILINTEIIQKTKQLGLISQNEYKDFSEDLSIKAIEYSIDRITFFINERAKAKYRLDLNYIYIYISKKYELDKYNYKEFLLSSILDIYLGKFLKINHEEKQKIKKWIYSLLYAEKKNKNEKIKLLNILFNKKIKEILLLYIDDNPYILINNKCKENLNFKLNLKSFKTFKDDFNEYNANVKKQIKDYIHFLLDNNNISNINYEEIYEESNEQNQNKELSKKKILKSNEKYTDIKRREIMKKGLQNFDIYIQANCEKYVERKLHGLTIKSQIGHSIEDYTNFFRKKVYDLYQNSLPRKLNSECKNDKSKYTHNIDIINEAIEKEKEKEKEDDRILYKIFKKEVIVKDILNCFIYDKKTIKKDGEKDIYINGFITYKDCFNDKYDEMKKRQNKEYFKDLLEGTIHRRLKSDERNKKLKGNPNLGKKRKNKNE